MDKIAIKKYAVWARRELITRVSRRAALYGITAEGCNGDGVSVQGRVLTAEERKQRSALLARIDEKGYEQIMEEAAYTWFNRFSALRFMEVNGYLPDRVRVFTDAENRFRPQILSEALSLGFDGLDIQRICSLKNSGDDEALFKYLLITQCNTLSRILPGMFQRISDYTELLFPDGMLREGSVIERMISLIPAEDWMDQVQIIGWLYQYYNTEPKDKVFAALKNNVKISKENIPAATQLFTPDWIVRYMVENSLGRLWLEGHPNAELKAGWKYYLDEAKQQPEVEERLAELRREYAALRPEDILVIDPCQGSGHILAYMFDVLVQIYESCGYSAREAVSCIVGMNLWGLDIDDRASQLAYFSVMMKARQYDHRFFSRGIQPNVYAIKESNGIDPHCIEYFVNGRSDLKAVLDTLLNELHEAKEYGSILQVSPVDFGSLYARFEEIRGETVPDIYSSQALYELLPFVRAAQALSQKYHAVVTNPPYMGAGNMNAKLTEYVKKHYPNGKTDLCTVFIERCVNMASGKSFVGMITQHGWMFLSSFEKLREALQKIDTMNMAHLGPRAFEEIAGEVVQTTSFVLRNSDINGYRAAYCRLIEPTTQQGKEDLFLSGESRFYSSKLKYSKIPGSPVAYWVSEQLISAFSDKSIENFGFAGIGMRTGDNNRFLRLWYEISFCDLLFRCKSRDEQIQSKKRWVPYNKGGEYRKWYGNNEYVVNWFNDGEEIKENTKKVYPYLDNLGWKISNESYYYKPGITWSGVTIAKNSFRVYEEGFIFDSGANGFFPYECNKRFIFAAYLNNCIAQYILSIINPTINTGSGTVRKIPIIIPENNAVLSKIEEIAKDCISLSRQDWDSFETSWDFRRHPLVRPVSTVAEAFVQWEAECETRFQTLKANEEELNRIFIDIYGLQDELTPEVDDKDVTVRRADLKRDIKSFISYAVGCMSGRYSLDVPGLAYAGGEWDASKYVSFIPDADAVLPICDDEYFEDDIVGRFIKFVEAVYGRETLEENLSFIAGALEGRGTPREVIRSYFLKDFYTDHLKVYQKRPIYWLFESGKKNGFKCLVYLHRYRPDMLARIRTDYVHEQQSRYRTILADLESRIDRAGTGERVKLTKRLNEVRAKAEELRLYEEKIHHLADRMIALDLDDGVKVNYAKFGGVLAKIK